MNIVNKLLFLIAVMIPGCFPQPDVSEPPPVHHTPDAGVTSIERCGKVPMMPGWAYTITAEDPSNIHVPLQQWMDHMQWVENVQEWAACVTMGGSSH